MQTKSSRRRFLRNTGKTLIVGASGFAVLDSDRAKAQNAFKGGRWQFIPAEWEPKNLDFGSMIGYQTSGDLPGITKVIWQMQTSIGGFNIFGMNDLVEMDFPNLVSVDPTNLQGSPLSISGCPNASILSCPLLQTVAGAFDFDGAAVSSITAPSLQSCASFYVAISPLLTSLSFPSLISVGGLLTGAGCGLVSISMPLLVSVGGNMIFDSNFGLSSVNLSSFLPTNGKDVTFINGALPDTAVNHILARCVASAGYVSGNVKLNGGTNAAPTGQGIIDKATLIGRGVTVLTT